MTPVSAVVLAALAAAAAIAAALRRAVVLAQPDEWLLCIRNGRLVRAGVGIQLWRLPGDVVVRFTSTVQRVGFAAEARTAGHVPVAVEGFILWSVSPDGEGPFRAYRKLGVVNLDAPPPGLRSPKHLLSTPQHKAFQQLLAAAVQRAVAGAALDDVLLHPDAVAARLRQALAGLEHDLGARVDQVELVSVRAADEALRRELTAPAEALVHEEAARARAEAAERTRRAEIEATARIAEEEATVRSRELDRERALRVVELEREALELSARLDRVRREAEASRDAMALVASAEEAKSQAVRDHELGRLVAEKVGDALARLPLREARWITVGPDTPAASLAGLVAAAREVARR